MAHKARILSVNVNGINQEKKRQEFFRYLKGKQPYLVLLQETYSCKQIESLWSNEWGKKIYFGHGDTNSRGVAIMLSHSFDGTVLGSWNDSEGRFVAIQCKINSRNLLIANVYGPNEDDPEFFLKLFNFLEGDNHDYEELIIAGDFNLTLDFAKDKRGSDKDTHIRKRGVLVQYLEQKNLTDIWRFLHPDLFQFTWRRMEPKITQSRLDYFLVSV